MDTPLPDADLVAIFSTTEAALIPLVHLTLEEAGIEHSVLNRGLERILGVRTSMSVGETDAPLQVLVRPADESRAREVLRDLATPGEPVSPGAPASTPPATAAAPAGAGSVALFDKDSGVAIGQITLAEFSSLTAILERESEDDDDYYVDEATLALLQDRQVDASVIDLLRRALGSRPGFEVRWVKQ